MSKRLHPVGVSRILIRALVTGLLLSAITPVSAATRLIINTIDNGITGKAQIVVSDGRVRLTHSAIPRQEILFLAADRQIMFIRHARKELVRVDPKALEQSINQLSGIAAQLQGQRESLTKEKRQQLDAMLKSLGVPDPDQALATAPTITAMGKTGQAAQISCQWWQIDQAHTVVAKACLTSSDDLGIDDADFRTLLVLATYVQQLQSSAGALLSTLGLSLPPLGLVDDQSLPIRLEEGSGRFVATLTAVDHLDVSLRLLAPAGYRIINPLGG